ncbi:hypothetical protein LJC49_00515 [Ruminococcaceae bacterium OttesenSCG-928-I18]|nr:hypothetical protein [Ruminococcaceae bacterium OttesenSCG-928-I18]
MKKQTKPKIWLVPALCYAAALLLYFGVCGFHLLADHLHRQSGQLEQKDLPFDSFYAEGVLLKDNDDGGTDIVSADPDPRLIYSPGEPFYATRFTFSAERCNKPGGEIVLYYTTRPGEDFSEQKRLSAQLAADGSWYFDLGGRRVTALRFDPDTSGGVLWRNWSITLNAQKPLADYFLPDARQVFALLFLPALLAAAMLEALHIRRNYLAARRGEGETDGKS